MRHIISVMLENESGALSRVSGLFTARGFNIESLTVAPTNDQTLSRLTMVSIGDANVIEQIIKQLNKLIDVVSVVELTDYAHFEREMLLIKIKKDAPKLTELCAEYEAKILKKTAEIYTIELSRGTEKIETFINEFQLTDIVEIARSGVTGLLQD